MMNKPTTSELQELETIVQGQASDLKVDEPDLRVWLSRMTVEDGEMWEHTVHVEERINDRWRLVLSYDGDNPEDEVVI